MQSTFWNQSIPGMGQQKPANPYGSGTNATYAQNFDDFFGKGVWGDKGMLDAQSQAGATPQAIAQRTAITQSQPQGGGFGGVQGGGLGMGAGGANFNGGPMGGGAMGGGMGQASSYVGGPVSGGMMSMGQASGNAPGSEWYSPERQQNIRNIYQQNLNNPAEISRSMREYGVSNDAFMRATGMDQAAFDKYMSPVFGSPAAGAGGTPPPGGLGGNSFTQNPYYSSMADDITRRVNLSRDQGLSQLRTNMVGVGGLGGARQGVAEGQAISGAADNLAGQLSALGGGMWNSDQNRDLSRYQGDQGFYSAQRGQDLAQVGLGADLIGRGLQAPWGPLNQANGIYGNYTGYGNNTTGGQQANWQTILGGGLAGLQFGNQMGWFK